MSEVGSSEGFCDLFQLFLKKKTPFPIKISMDLFLISALQTPDWYRNWHKTWVAGKKPSGKSDNLALVIRPSENSFTIRGRDIRDNRKSPSHWWALRKVGGCF